MIDSTIVKCPHRRQMNFNGTSKCVDCGYIYDVVDTITDHNEGFMLIINHTKKKAWKHELDGIDYKEAMESLKKN